jgi:DNA polymerase (family 10)
LELVSVGEIRRQMPVVEIKEALSVGNDAPVGFDFQTHDLPIPAKLWIRGDERLWTCDAQDLTWVRWYLTGPDEHVRLVVERMHQAVERTGQEIRRFDDEEQIYRAAGMNYVPPPRRDARHLEPIPLMQLARLRGLVHVHTTYSDGAHSLRQMALAAQSAGYEYLGVSDHSRSAAYAGGLSIEAVRRQHQEIDALNDELAPFRIFKGIESDILADGSLDYPDDVLETFDFVIASVHSNLKMDESQATERILRAVSHPRTTILGHPTGRLLLSREGYPLDHRAVIDRCAETNTAIEINANPARLDLDWRWVDYAVEKGVKICIHPDAHSIEGIEDTSWGVAVAQKTALTPENCFNAADASEFERLCKKK